MDAEEAEFRDALRQLEGVRDGVLAQAEGYLAEGRRRLAEMEAGNRFQRRRASRAARMLGAFETWFRRRVDQVFADAVKGVNCGAGTLTAVQDEAAARLAAIFS